jgi:hypothetical protein
VRQWKGFDDPGVNSASAMEERQTTGNRRIIGKRKISVSEKSLFTNGASFGTFFAWSESLFKGGKDEDAILVLYCVVFFLGCNADFSSTDFINEACNDR